MNQFARRRSEVEEEQRRLDAVAEGRRIFKYTFIIGMAVGSVLTMITLKLLR